jgi:phage N-6-adenine-methyltransferase
MPRQKPGTSKQNYATPAAFINAVKLRLRVPGFAFDFAAEKSNAQCPRYWSKRDDALSKTSVEWAQQIRGAGWGWLNPPFDDIQPWAYACENAEVQGAHIALLTPASVGSNWFNQHIHGRALVLALNGRLDFIPGKVYPKDCILSLFGPTVSPGFDVWRWK